ncbi:MAG TPA: DUF2937 family protein [Spirochaetota bacterium]|nr:DUF2937 family protein [Spirochaetota bacterium]OPZ37567.1 MAG: hypothetical protein BWY96_01637 [Spirochaetes bacterium ADurb.BinA120]HNU91413.1 DUF2937 family protein [Spirochaetota bacterium]HPI13751.1 DUF2937 family protein [Spirochaetota bacterium]HPO45389.1 DUF2937 family protein [Spirochaetota bacterium]
MSKIIEKLLVSVDGFVDRICSVLGALIFVQVPVFITQYIQRLGGHVDELARVVNQYRASAADTGKTLEEYVRRFLSSSEADFVSAGANMQGNIDRLADIELALEQLTNAGPFSKFFYFLKNIDLEITRATIKNYTPGMNISLEGAVYALVGLLVGMLVYFFVKKLFALLGRKIFRRGRSAPVN